MKKKFAKRTPKSQSEKAADKKSKALERAGTAIIEGKRAKAEEIIKPKVKKLSKKQREAGAALLVADLRVKLTTIRALDFEIEVAKTRYAKLKKERDQKNAELLQELGDSAQGRLPFEEKPRSTKDVDAAVKGANEPAKDGAPADPAIPAAGGPTQQEIDDAGKQLDAMTGESIDGDKSDGLPEPAQRAKRGGKRTKTVTHEAVGAA